MASCRRSSFRSPRLRRGRELGLFGWFHASRPGPNVSHIMKRSTTQGQRKRRQISEMSNSDAMTFRRPPWKSPSMGELAARRRGADGEDDQSIRLWGTDHRLALSEQRHSRPQVGFHVSGSPSAGQRRHPERLSPQLDRSLRGVATKEKSSRIFLAFPSFRLHRLHRLQVK